ncbi:MAG: cytochrome c oxidase subunit 3 family protein [Bacteroidales bacterium]|nr:cytochrome c oxidase subunit 3 family protein [Bacteroidales bacterium]MCF8456688.1 cytochrome c oxidase subunit 3 family protein [Bacteroidales bacterium]
MEATVHATGHVAHRDDEGKRMGMWLFLFTEVLLFGGLFIVYAAYRFINPEDFHTGSQHLDWVIGAINTVILLTSSLTVALSISAIQSGNTKKAKILLYLTLAFALAFLVNKYFEWGGKIHHGLFPGMEEFKHLTHGESLFFVLYFFMTGLHGLHIIAGGIFIGFILYYINKGEVTSESYTLHENAGLYWHLVDVIWIYLFPLFYLII